MKAMMKAVLIGLALTASARADEIANEARLSCRREASPGRVLCELEVEVTEGRLVWGDALVVSAPDFALPLRSRVGDKSATARAPRRVRLPLALAATKTGRGELKVRARAVACVERKG